MNWLFGATSKTRINSNNGVELLSRARSLPAPGPAMTTGITTTRMDAAIVNNADNNDVSIKHELTSSSSTKSLRSTASSAVSGLVRAASRGRLRQPQQEQQQSAGSRARSRGRGLVKGIGGAGGAVWRIGGTGGTGGVGGEIAGDTDAIAPLAPPADLASVSAPPASIEPDDWVALSIYYHENTPHLHVSAYYASLAAAAGSGVGLFLYAIALRHGLGVAQDSRRGLQLLCRAADAAMDAIENPSSTTSNSADPSSENHNQQHLDNDYPPPLLHSESFSSAAPSAFSETLSRLPGSGAVRHLAKRELAAALYEIANCYRNGWGVDAVSEPTALYYYTVASSLGDCDAHVALADCYMRGECGIKADKRIAAKYYRLATAAGYKEPGLHWIYKEKYRE